jgi:uncharacterized protein YlzI (FlbEa/FlbD family)
MYPMMNGLKEVVKHGVAVVVKNIKEIGRKHGNGLNKRYFLRRSNYDIL